MPFHFLPTPWPCKYSSSVSWSLPPGGKVNCISRWNRGFCVHHRQKDQRQPPYICNPQYQSPVFEPKSGLGLVLDSNEQCVIHSPFRNLRCVSASVILYLITEVCLEGRPFSGLCLLRLMFLRPHISIPGVCSGALINLGFSERTAARVIPLPVSNRSHEVQRKRKCLPVP